MFLSLSASLSTSQLYLSDNLSDYLYAKCVRLDVYDGFSPAKFFIKNWYKAVGCELPAGFYSRLQKEDMGLTLISHLWGEQHLERQS